MQETAEWKKISQLHMKDGEKTSPRAASGISGVLVAPQPTF